MELSITLVIIIITVLISIGGFSNHKTIDDLIFYPPAITRQKQWYRFFTSGLIHADWGHLLFNMLSLYLFGESVEKNFVMDYAANEVLFGKQGRILYLAMYVLALFVCLLPTFIQHKNDYYYRSLGASGAVSAVIFAGLLIEPRNRVGFFFIPPVIPGYIFGPLYLIISSYLGRQSKDNVNHSAHFWGAVFGIVFVIGMATILKSDYKPVEYFIIKVRTDLGL
ncbi:MAG: rhomboid family intramembrane serine protease [Chitinophagaceae bacterium]